MQPPSKTKIFLSKLTHRCIAWRTPQWVSSSAPPNWIITCDRGKNCPVYYEAYLDPAYSTIYRWKLVDPRRLQTEKPHGTEV